MTFKRLLKALTCLLVCVGILSAIAGQTRALNAAGSLYDTNLIPENPEESAPGFTQTSQLSSKVHRSASYGSQLIGCFKEGTKLTVLGSSGSFYKVDCFDMAGYIAKSQVQQTEAGEYIVRCQEESSETTYLPTYTMQQTLTLRQQVLEEAQKHIGVRYVSGGSTPRGFDCSGYTQYVFAQLQIEIMRHELKQMANSIIIPREELQIGDFVIFSYTGDNGGFASHIGIYVGNDQVIHASSSKGITISDLNSYYYASHYQCARRILITQNTPAASLPVTGVIQSVGSSYWRSDSTDASPFLNH